MQLVRIQVMMRKMRTILTPKTPITIYNTHITTIIISRYFITSIMGQFPVYGGVGV